MTIYFLISEPTYFKFQSTPSVKRVTNTSLCGYVSDFISIHTLCEEGDGKYPIIPDYPFIFQSTPSVKRVTSVDKILEFKEEFQSTPSVKRVTLGKT